VCRLTGGAKRVNRMKLTRTRTLVTLAVCVAALMESTGVKTQAAANNWYVSAAGTGTGTQASPMSLAKALASTSPAQPGDTIWLRGGTYLGAFSSQLTGTAAAPIVVRGYPGERVTLDANTAAARAAGSLLAVGGAHVVFRDFEVTSSDTGRTDQNVGWGNFPSGIDINASTDIKLVNLVIHDLVGKGVGAWTENTDAEIYGCLIYYNGMSDHDHGIYLQNQTGRKRVADNILFDQASHGIHGYGSSDAYLDNITLEGNTVFENGGLLGQSARNILLGGGRVAQNPVVRANHTYLRGSLGNSNVGYTAGTANAVVQDNYWVAGNAAVRFNLDAGAVVTGNFFAGPLDPSDTATRWPSNTFAAAKPTTGQTVFVRPNQYEAGRATVTIYNWSKASTVAVSLTNTGLVPGDSFEIRDAMNFYGAPVAAGLYTGAPVSIPMTGLTAALPVGSSLTPPPHTAPAFGAFLVLKTAAGGGTGGVGGADNTPPNITITSPTAGQTITGTATLAALASDDTQVTGVQFLVDGTNVGGEDTTVPYAFSWNTTGAVNGTHSVTAIARDTAGNQATSAAVAVAVNNASSPPPSSAVRVVVQAESASLTSPFGRHKESAASDGQYISTHTTNAGSATISFTIPTADTYVVWARVLGRDDSHDSFFVLADGQGRDVFDVAEGKWSASWQWSVINGRSTGGPASISPRTFMFSKGTHTLTFEGREADTWLDEILITNDLNAAPENAGAIDK
jgi:hypothetical protein